MLRRPNYRFPRGHTHRCYGSEAHVGSAKNSLRRFNSTALPELELAVFLVLQVCKGVGRCAQVITGFLGRDRNWEQLWPRSCSLTEFTHSNKNMRRHLVGV